MIHPYFQYLNIVWGICHSTVFNRLYLLQKKAVCIITFSTSDLSYCSFIQEIEYITIIFTEWSTCLLFLIASHFCFMFFYQPLCLLLTLLSLHLLILYTLYFTIGDHCSLMEGFRISFWQPAIVLLTSCINIVIILFWWINLLACLYQCVNNQTPGYFCSTFNKNVYYHSWETRYKDSTNTNTNSDLYSAAYKLSRGANKMSKSNTK